MKVRTNTYWRHKIFRQRIYRVAFVYPDRVIATNDYDGLGTTWEHFVETYEPLNRLEVLVLFGEVV